MQYLSKDRAEWARRKSAAMDPSLMFLSEYKTQIIPTRFHLKNVETFNSFTHLQLENLQGMWMHENKLQQLIVNGMKLHFLYDPLDEALKKYTSELSNMHKIQTIIRILAKGQFYRFLPNKEDSLKLMINNRTTQANVKILIAGLLTYSMKKLTLQEISSSLLLFNLEESLYGTAPNGIPVDQKKINRLLKKIERFIKPLEFKTWLDDLKTSKGFNDFFEPHHFLYLASMSEKKFINSQGGLKFINGLGGLLFNDRRRNQLFKNLNIDMLDVNQAQKKLNSATNTQQQKIRVKGLSLCEFKHIKDNTKQLLKELRLHRYTKKRPATADFRKDMVEDVVELQDRRSKSLAKIALNVKTVPQMIKRKGKHERVIKIMKKSKQRLTIPFQKNDPKRSSNVHDIHADPFLLSYVQTGKHTVHHTLLPFS